MDILRSKGCKYLNSKTVTDLVLDEETDCMSEVVCGKENIYSADAVILAIGISTLQGLIKNRFVVSHFCYIVLIEIAQ